MFKGVFEVEATGGDSLLGGEDFDARIIDWLAEPFLQKHGIDLRKDKMSLQRLRDAAEKAKCELSALKNVEINLPFISATQKSGPLHLQTSLTRELLETMTEDLVGRCLKVCERVMLEAKVHPGALGDVLLVGGQTRMPKIQAAVKNLFGRDPSKTVNPDEAVALGAAIQGSMLLHDESEMLLLDVTPHSLGIAIAGGFFQRIIPKNTTVPTSAHHVFTTVKDDQPSAKITVLQGEAELAADNELLGEFMLTGLRAAPRGGVDIDVIFDISADGIVSVSAVDVQTGVRQSITVTRLVGLDRGGDQQGRAGQRRVDAWVRRRTRTSRSASSRPRSSSRSSSSCGPSSPAPRRTAWGRSRCSGRRRRCRSRGCRWRRRRARPWPAPFDRLERMLGALRGAVERGLGGK